MRQNQLEGSSSISKSNARVISTALPPSEPSFPNQKMFIMMGLAVGIVISALIVMPKSQEDPYRPLPDGAPSLEGRYLPDELGAGSRTANPAIGPGPKS
jgi:hypothetical protein